MANWDFKRLALLGATLLVLPLAAKSCGGMMGARSASLEARTNPSAAALSPQSTDMIVQSSTQSSQGVSEEQMDVEYLDALGEYVANRIYINAVRAQKEGGGLPVEEMTPESVYTTIGGKKLGVIRIRTQGATPMAVIIGIDKLELKQVICINHKIEDVIVTRGKCLEEINKTFNLNRP